MIKKLPWWVGGIAMALLLLFTFATFGADRPIGASTYVPYFSGIIFDLDPAKYEYLQKIHNAGSWEGVMLLGVLLGAFLNAVFVTKTFEWTVVPSAWKKYKNDSATSRLFWSFVGGFFLIIGARLAGGCTSGHFLSGVTQTAFSSLLFGGVVMASLIITGKIFYKDRKNDL
ncbi:MAG: YeeE/YedE family protein [Epsilonproteobacteria bacterium]|nr:YeeE/YedE family protein [Campylobacterota bacterium]